MTVRITQQGKNTKYRDHTIKTQMLALSFTIYIYKKILIKYKKGPNM